MTIRRVPAEQIAVPPGPTPNLAAPLKVLVSHEDGRTHVVLMGELDVSTARFLAEQLLDATAASTGDMVIDAGLLDFIGSTGLSVLVSQHKALQAQGRTLTLLDPAPSIRRLFEITALDQVMTIEPATVQTAEPG
jgi:anti-sigma B factor antagonist